MGACMDANATNYDADATVQGYDQYAHLMDVFMEIVLVHC